MCVCVCAETSEQLQLSVCVSQQDLHPLLLPPPLVSHLQLRQQQQLHLLMETLALLWRNTGRLQRDRRTERQEDRETGGQHLMAKHQSGDNIYSFY